MRSAFVGLLVWFALAGALRAEGERAGDFDYYLLALSWTPAWCALTGDARADPQCGAGSGRGWQLHGLWPQFETGWPSYCRTGERDPTRAETSGMADIMGGSGPAFHQWKKHGRCSGLPPAEFFDVSRRAFGSVTLPEVFDSVRRDLSLAAPVVEAAFTEANPGLDPKAITVVCRKGLISEVRICLTRGLAPRACGADVAADCTLQDALLEAPR